MDLSESRKYLCLPLDVKTEQEALSIVDELKDYVGCFKVGMQLFTSCGPGLVKSIIARGCKVFLDLKYHDIPNTVYNAVLEAGKLGVSFITIHLSGGSEMISATVNALSELSEDLRPMVLGVTVLTSMSEIQLSEEIGVSREINEQIISLIELGKSNGLSGIVCSPSDLSQFKDRFKELFFVTPGIRPSWSQKNDQKRIATPCSAIKSGSSLLVIGRPILLANDRKEAVIKILEEIELCLKNK